MIFSNLHSYLFFTTPFSFTDFDYADTKNIKKNTQKNIYC